MNIRFAAVLCALHALGMPVAQAALSTSASASTSLRGSAAIDHLRNRGQYESLAAAVNATRYGMKPVSATRRKSDGSYYVADNPNQAMWAAFAPQGLSLSGSEATTIEAKAARPAKPGWQLRLSLQSAGYGEAQWRARHGQPVAQAERLEIAHHLQAPAYTAPASVTITEWYVNRPDGLEHGYTLAQPPGAARNQAPLRVQMALHTDLQAKTAAGGQAVVFHDAGGAARLRYDRLKVWDAGGEMLAAHDSAGSDAPTGGRRCPRALSADHRPDLQPAGVSEGIEYRRFGLLWHDRCHFR